MYLATLATDDREIVQGMLAMPGLPFVPAELLTSWWDTYARLVDNLYAVGSAGAALRVVLEPRTGVTAALLVAAAEHRSPQLRRFLAPFTRLETIVPDSARLPLTRTEYDTVADEFPLVRCTTTAPGFEAGNAWFACDFRVGSNLESMILEADAYGYRLGYHVNVRPTAIDEGWQRMSRRNALAVSELAGVPQGVSALQLQLSQRLADASAICEEYVAVDPGEPEAWLQASLERQFRARFGGLRFETPEWQLEEGGYEDQLACPALLEPDQMSLAELCSAAVTEREITSLLTWVSPQSLSARGAQPYVPEQTEEALRTPTRELPQQSGGDEPFVFISYKRSDFESIVPIVQDLQRRGWRIWYDKGIPGGAEWNAMLEERLVSCSGVLLFLSQSAVDSKWVRREVRFADSLDKPIIGIQLEQAELRHGMRLLLEHYQLLSKDAREFLDELNRSLTLIIPTRSGA